MRNLNRVIISAGVILAVLGSTFAGHAAIKKPIIKNKKVAISYSKVAVLAKQSSKVLLQDKPTSLLMKQLSVLSQRERRIHGYLTGVALRRSLDQQVVSVSHLMRLAASLDLTTEARARVISGAATDEFGALMDIYESSPQLQQLVTQDRLELLPGVREGIEIPEAAQIDITSAIEQNIEIHESIQNDIHDIANMLDEIYHDRIDYFVPGNGGYGSEGLSEFESWLVDVMIGATIAGVESKLTGGSFWEGFSEYVAQEVMAYVVSSIANWADEHADDGGFIGAVATFFSWAIDTFGGGTDKDTTKSDDNGENAAQGEKDDCFTKVGIPDWPTNDVPEPMELPGPLDWPFSLDVHQSWANLQVNHGLSSVAATHIVQSDVAIDTLMVMLTQHKVSKAY